MKIKVKYSELKKKSVKELLEMKKTFKKHLMDLENRRSPRKKGFAPSEVKKNIARINKVLEEKK